MAFQGDSIYWVEVEKIVPNPFQPRREFDEQKLKELAESVRMYGILQPLTVTRNEIQREDGTFYTEYELVAGERRLRASKLAGLSQVPVIIREGENNEQEKLEIAIIENLQREDLNAVDRALAFRQLAEVFGLSHTQVAQKVGRSREYVSNTIRLLGLPDYMLDSLRRGEMTEGHARTLLMLNDRPEEQDVVFREILLKKLSVREVERIVRKIATDKVRKKHDGEFDTELIEMEKRFMETLGTRVQIQKTDYGGRLTIDYFSVEDLEGMLTRMKTDQLNTVSAQDQSDMISANTPVTIIKEDEEVSSKVDEALLYPASLPVDLQLESPVNPNQIDKPSHEDYSSDIPSVPVAPAQHYSEPTPVPTSTSVPEPMPMPESRPETTNRMSENRVGENDFIRPAYEAAPVPEPATFSTPAPAQIPTPAPVSSPVTTPVNPVAYTQNQAAPIHATYQAPVSVTSVYQNPVVNNSVNHPRATNPAPSSDSNITPAPNTNHYQVPPLSTPISTPANGVVHYPAAQHPTQAPTGNVAPKVEDESNLYSIRNFSV